MSEFSELEFSSIPIAPIQSNPDVWDLEKAARRNPTNFNYILFTVRHARIALISFCVGRSLSSSALRRLSSIMTAGWTGGAVASSLKGTLDYFENAN